MNPASTMSAVRTTNTTIARPTLATRPTMTEITMMPRKVGAKKLSAARGDGWPSNTIRSPGCRSMRRTLPAGRPDGPAPRTHRERLLVGPAARDRLLVLKDRCRGRQEGRAGSRAQARDPGERRARAQRHERTRQEDRPHGPARAQPRGAAGQPDRLVEAVARLRARHNVAAGGAQLAGVGHERQHEQRRDAQ